MVHFGSTFLINWCSLHNLVFIKMCLKRNPRSTNSSNLSHFVSNRSTLSHFLHMCGLNENVFKTTCICFRPISLAYPSNSLPAPTHPSSLNGWQIAGFSHETSIFNQSDWWQHATPSMSQTQKFSKFTRLLCQCSRGTLSAINESDNADVIVNARLQPCNCVVSY